MKKSVGISFLEIVLAMTLLATTAPIFFGIFFTNVNWSTDLSTRRRLLETANDVRSFVRLSDYETLFDLTKNSSILAIREVDEDEMLVRDFIPLNSEKCNCDFVVQFEPSNNDKTAMMNASTTCAFPLKCKISHVKHKSHGISKETLSSICDARYDILLVKNR
jgi:hypothetical protein